MSETRLFTFSSGGWVVLVAVIVSVALTTWAIMPALLKQRPPGDGTNIESYGFDLSTLLVPASEMSAPMLHRDMVPRLDYPDTLTTAQAWAINEEQRGKFLVSNDRIVGVAIDGEARAYPISLLTVHEIINDTLGGVPIAVTYSWPGDAVRVFDRSVGDQVVELGVSGLLYNANMLMYDRREDDPEVDYFDRGESLWTQLQGRAISGPAAEAGLSLTPIPAQLVSWSHWQKMQPETTVIQRDPHLIKRYRRAEPRQYFMSSEPIPFPVKPLPEHGPGLKDRVVVVQMGENRKVYPMALLARRAASDDGRSVGDRRAWDTELNGTRMTFIHDAAANTVVVEAEGDIDVIHCFWFAWHALHPGDPLAGE